MMSFRNQPHLSCWAALIVVCAWSGPAAADDRHDDGQWVLTLRVAELLASPIAQTGLAAMTEGADSRELDEAVGRCAKVLGIDPRKDIERLEIRAAIRLNDIENIESLTRSVSQITLDVKTTGNLEGILLALPGYRSDTLAAASANVPIAPLPQNATRHFCTLPEIGTVSVTIWDLAAGVGGQGATKRILIASHAAESGSPNPYAPSAYVASMSGPSPAKLELPPAASLKIPATFFRQVESQLAAENNELIAQIMGNVVKQVSGVTLECRRDADNKNFQLIARVRPLVKDRARQLSQLAAAAVQFASSEIEEVGARALLETAAITAADEAVVSVQVNAEQLLTLIGAAL